MGRMAIKLAATKRRDSASPLTYLFTPMPTRKYKAALKNKITTSVLGRNKAERPNKKPDNRTLGIIFFPSVNKSNNRKRLPRFKEIERLSPRSKFSRKINGT